MTSVEKKPIIALYLDWTDAIAHLNPSEVYAVGETKEERERYTHTISNNFFGACKRLEEAGYQLDIHIITGGTIDYLRKWNEQNIQLAKAYGTSHLFASLTTEYGGDIIVNYSDNDDKVKSILVPHKFDYDNELREKVETTLRREIPSKYKPVFTNYDYFQNLRLEDENMTEEEFNVIVRLVRSIEGNEQLDFYPYYCPGYGVEIDILQKGLNKARAVAEINDLFYKTRVYKGQPVNVGTQERVVLNIFNGDFAQVDLQMVPQAVNKNVLFVASQDTKDIRRGDITGRMMIGGNKLNAVTQALEMVYDELVGKKTVGEHR